MRIICALLLCANVVYAQETYQIGAMNAAGYSTAVTGQIIIGDSTVTFKFAAQQTVKKIQNKQQSVIYVTDGTAIDKMTITPLTGKTNGFRFDYSIVYDGDKKFTNSQVIYFCRKTP